MEDIVKEIQKVTFSNGQTFKQLFEFVKIIGEGAFGLVIHVQKKLDGSAEDRALKIIQKSKVPQYAFESIRNEAEILQQLQVKFQATQDGHTDSKSLQNGPNEGHPNIVQFYRLFETEQFGIIEMEFVPDGTVGHLIKNYRAMAHTQEIPHDHDYQVSQIMMQIIQAVSLVHKNDLVHRDIKPENILCSKSTHSRDEIQIKLADFGLATHFKVSLSHKDQLMERAGTFKYMAPEQAFQGKIYGKKIDMWACGIIMYKLLSCGDHPLAPGKVTEKDFTELLRDPKWNFPEHFTDYAIDFFLKLCDYSPTNRYTAQQALQHPWINRNFISSPIPKTQLEEIIDQSAQQSLKQAINFALLTQIMKGNPGDQVKQRSFQEYKKACQEFIKRPQSRSQNFNDSLSHSISRRKMSSEHTVISPSAVNKSIMSSPHSLSSPKKSDRFKGIKFTVENTEHEPTTPQSIFSPDRSPNRASGIDPKMLIFRDERQFQTIQENTNDDVADTKNSKRRHFNSPNTKHKASLPAQIHNKKRKVVSRIAIDTDQSHLTSFDNRRSSHLKSEMNQFQVKPDPNSSSPGHSEGVGGLVDYIMPQLDIEIIENQNFETIQNQVNFLTQVHRSARKEAKTSKMMTPRKQRGYNDDVELAVESNYDQYMKAVHQLQKDQYKTKIGRNLIDATVKQDRQQIFLVPNVYSKNTQIDQLSQVNMQDKKIQFKKNKSQEKLSPVNTSSKKKMESKHSMKRAATVVRRRGSSQKKQKKAQASGTLNLPQIERNISLGKSRSKRSLKQKSVRGKKRKNSNESADMSEDEIYEGYDNRNNIVNLRLQGDFGGRPSDPSPTLVNIMRIKKPEFSLPSIPTSSSPSPFMKGQKSPTQGSINSQNVFATKRTSAISEILQGSNHQQKDQMHINKVFHNLTKLRIQMDQQLDKQDKAKFGFKQEEATPQNINFKYLAYISPQYEQLIQMIKQRHEERENLRSKLQQQEKNVLKMGTDREGFGSMSQSPTHRHKKLIQDRDSVKKMQSQLEKIRVQMEASNLGLDGIGIDSACINEFVDKIAAFGVPIDSEMMKFSSLRPSDYEVSPRTGSPHNSVISYDQFIEQMKSFLRDQAIGNPSPVNQQILQLRDNQILMLAKNLVEQTIAKQEGDNSPVFTLNQTGPIDQGVGVVTESFSQQIRDKSSRNVTKASGTHTLQLQNSKIASRDNSPIVTVQKLQRQAALDKKKHGAVTHTMTNESDDDLKGYNRNQRPTSTRLDELNGNPLMLQETLESPKSGTVQNNTTNIQSREDLKSPRNFLEQTNDQHLMTEITEAANRSSIVDGEINAQKTPLKTPFLNMSQEGQREKEEKKHFESPQVAQRKAVDSGRKNIHVQFQSASNSIERSLTTHGAHYRRLRHNYPNNEDLQAMRESLSQEKIHYTKFNPSSATPKIAEKSFKNYQELRQEQDRMDKLILQNHQVDAQVYAKQARRNLEKKQQYLEQVRQDQRMREIQNANNKVQFEFQHGVSHVYAPVLKTQALGQVMITDEDVEEFSPLHNPVTLAQPSHVGPSVEVTVSKAVSVYESTHDDPTHTPMQPSQSRDHLLSIPKASTNSLSISDAAIIHLQNQMNVQIPPNKQAKNQHQKQSPENSRSRHVSQEIKHRKVLNIDHEMRKMMQENKKLEHHVDVRASASDSAGKVVNNRISSNYQIVHQVINDYTKKIDSNGTAMRGVTKNGSLMSQARFGDITNNNANTADLDYSHYGSPTSPMETPGNFERHVRISAQNQPQIWKQRQLSTIDDVNSKVRKENTEMTLDRAHDEKSLELIDKDEEILIEEQGDPSSNGDQSKTPIVMMDSPEASMRQKSPIQILRPLKTPSKISQKSNEDLEFVNANQAKKQISILKVNNPVPLRNQQTSQMSHIQVKHKSKQVAQGTQMAIPTATNFLTKWEHLSEAKGDTRLIVPYKSSQGEVVSNRTMSNIEPSEQVALQAMIEMDQTKRPFDQMILETNPNVKIIHKVKSPKRSVDLNNASGNQFRNSKSNSKISDFKVFETTEQSKFDPMSPSSAMLREQLNIFEQRKQHLQIIKNQLSQQSNGQIRIMKMDNELLDFSENLRGMQSNNATPYANQNIQGGRNHPLTFPKKSSLKQSQQKSNHNSSQRDQKSHSALGLVGVGTQVQMPSRKGSQMSLMSIVDQASDQRKIIQQQINQDIIFGIDGSQYEELMAKNKMAAERQQMMPSRMKNISQINNISANPAPYPVQRTGFLHKKASFSINNMGGKGGVKDNKRSTLQMESQPPNSNNIQSSINYIPKNAGRMEKTQVGSW